MAGAGSSAGGWNEGAAVLRNDLIRLSFAATITPDLPPDLPLAGGEERPVRLGADVTFDVIPGLDHGINREAADRLVERLKQERGQSTATYATCRS